MQLIELQSLKNWYERCSIVCCMREGKVKKTMVLLRKRMVKRGSRQGNGTVEMILFPHIARWVLRHSSINQKHILFLLGCRDIDSIVNGEE